MDLISGETVNTGEFILKPYQYVWLTANDSELNTEKEDVNE
jgi:hypothetical protein